MSEERSAGLVIFVLNDGEPNFLLLRYSWGHWGFPKGNIELNETEKEAALREAKEETGLQSYRLSTDFKEKIEYFYRRKRKIIHKEVIYFLAETDETDIKLSDEHRGYQWLNFKEALNKLSFDDDKKILRKANKRIKIFTSLR